MRIRSILKVYFFLIVSFFNNSLAQTVKTGIDVLIESNFSDIRGKKVLLLTNSSGRNANGISTLDIFSKYLRNDFIGVLAPEHGYFTAVPAGQAISDESIDGIKIYSVYGTMKEPSRSVLNQADAIVVDIQDIGVRSYTYISTLHRTLKAAANIGKEVIVLDRPNPIGGMIVDGNVLEAGMESFVGVVRIPYIHGLTIGELALMMNEELWLGINESEKNLKCNLKVIKMSGWERWMAWEDTELMWFPTSPHVPTVDAVRGLACIGIFGEIGLMSIGIGSTSPFQYIGSPNFNSKAVLEFLSTQNLPGIHLSQARFQPFYGMYSGKNVESILFRFPLSNEFLPYTTGIKIILAIREIHPELFTPDSKRSGIDMFQKVTGTKDLYNALFNNLPVDVVLKISSKGLNEFLILRNKYLLY